MNRNHKDLEEKITSNTEKIASLTKDLKESSRNKEKEIVSLKNEIVANKKKIASLEEELRISLTNAKSQEEKITSLKNENESLVKRLEEVEGEVQKLRKDKVKDESVFTIMQIGTKVQRNMCKYVLGETFKEDFFYKFKDIEKYMEEDLQHTDKQEAARRRLKEVRENIPWNQRLVDSLKMLHHMRIGTAHPNLSYEKIQQATEYLKEEKILSQGMITNINKLREKWEISEGFLQTSSAEDQDEGNVPSARLGNKSSYAASKPTNRRASTPPPKRDRSSEIIVIK